MHLEWLTLKKTLIFQVGESRDLYLEMFGFWENVQPYLGAYTNDLELRVFCNSSVSSSGTDSKILLDNLDLIFEHEDLKANDKF